MSSQLFKRQALSAIEPFLHTTDVLVLHGARQVGKTSILMYLQAQLQASGANVVYMDLEDSRFLSLLNRGVPDLLLYLRESGHRLDDGHRLYLMLDEIQYLDNPSSLLKLLADHHRYLKVIVSGSSSFEMKSKFRDSLVGRIVSFEIYPLSFAEFLLFKGVPFERAPRFTPEKNAELQTLYAEFVLYGGYPKIVLTDSLALKERYLQQIIDAYIRKDIRDLANIRDVDKFNQLVTLLAAQSGNLLNVEELANTCRLARATVERYLFLLEQTYVVRLVRPFSRNLRSELTKTPKIFFCDTGLMQMVWLKRLQSEVLGPAFETSIFAELLKRYPRETVYFWRTTDKKEVDFVVRLPDQTIPIETKLHFPRNEPVHLHSFMAAYPDVTRTASYRVVALYGQPATPAMIYPWQL